MALGALSQVMTTLDDAIKDAKDGIFDVRQTHYGESISNQADRLNQKKRTEGSARLQRIQAQIQKQNKRPIGSSSIYFCANQTKESTSWSKPNDCAWQYGRTKAPEVCPRCRS